MNKKTVIIVTILLIACNSVFSQNEQKKDMVNQVLKNFHINWTTRKTDDYKWNNFGFGSGYSKSFSFEEKLTWRIGADINWSKYTLNYTGRYDAVKATSFLNTTSLSFPLTIDYLAYKTFWTGFNVYTGPVYEQIFYINPNNYFASNLISRSQFGWTLGARFRFAAIFSLRLSYDYYFTGMFKNGDMKRSGVHFSLGF